MGFWVVTSCSDVVG